MGGLKMEENEEMVVGHDASTEPPPQCPIYHPSYKIVKEKLAEMIELLHQPLYESTYTDNNVEELKSLLKKRSEARFPDEVRIALVGDMASGKSSLINSLLSVGILARKVRLLVLMLCRKLMQHLGRCWYQLHLGHPGIQIHFAQAKHTFQS